jgi:hypothetical protein
MRINSLKYLVIVFLLLFGVAPLFADEENKDMDRLSPKDVKQLWVFRESVVLGVPEADLAHLVADCKEQSFTISEIQRLLSLIARAKLAGLPHKDLLLKLREGLEKEASPELVYSALAHKALILRRAKTTVDTLLLEGFAAPDYEMAIKIVGDALEAGMEVQGILSSVRKSEGAVKGLPDPLEAFDTQKSLKRE